MSGDWSPAFASQRPPFEPGNDVATTHGARSERRIAPRAQAILDELVSDPSLPAYLQDPSYRGALAGLARAEAIVSLLEDHLATLNTAQATKGNLPILEQYRRWLTTVQTHRRALGLDPMSRGALTKDLAVAKANAAEALRNHTAEGAQALAARQEQANG